MNRTSLIEFIRDQFRRIDCWCWDTVIEEVAAVYEIPLDADRLTYAGGSMRTGKHRLRRNDARWRAHCQRMQTDEDAVMCVLADVEAALRSPSASGVSAQWRSMIDSRIAKVEGRYTEYARHLLNWNGDYYLDVGVRDASPIVDSAKSVVYGLWRLDTVGKPIQPFPLYVGEGSGTARDRLEGSHRKWWGDGKPIGVTVCTADPGMRLEIEKASIDMLVPFCNIKGRKFDRLWKFPRP